MSRVLFQQYQGIFDTAMSLSQLSIGDVTMIWQTYSTIGLIVMEVSTTNKSVGIGQHRQILPITVFSLPLLR